MFSAVDDFKDAINPIGIRQKGSIIIDGREVANTVQCCHCSAHFVMRRGSGAQRGYCTRCAQITCGDVECNPCVPFQKKLEEIERKANFDLRYAGF